MRDPEERIIRLVHEGLKDEEIGLLVGNSENVVKNRLRVIYDKLGLWNRTELALWYEKRRCEKCPLRTSPELRVPSTERKS